MLEKITSPADVRGLTPKETDALCAEIRENILTAVSKNGGHLASNLGLVEPTVVIHRVFDSPDDAILFDVGHQAYTHKLLTGRYERFDTLRTFGGISGFTNPEESEHDKFFAGHSGTALASAIGIAEANRIAGNEHWAVAVVGDGSMTNGMIYEALNNCAERDIRLVIILNDNEMSIAQNVGGMSKYLAKARTSRRYFMFKDTLKKVCGNIPLLGRGIMSIARGIKEFIKRNTVSKNVFECLGIEYLGPVRGTDIKRLTDVLEHAKHATRPILVHVLTKKGDGYEPAVTEPEIYHSCGSFDKATGVVPKAGATFSSEFGRAVCDMAKEDPSVCAVTAAMAEGTGLARFATLYPDRFFDVGIAEEYAVTFAAGLAKAGLTPVCALYSTFAQRVYDQLWHDVALQKLPLIMGLDRSGIVPGDGPTHQGIFDYSMLTSIPGITVDSPETYGELRASLAEAKERRTLSVIRYPKGSEAEYDRSGFSPVSGGSLYEGGERLIITYGAVTENAYKAATAAGDTSVLKLTRIFPLPEATILDACRGRTHIVIAEEGAKSGSAAEKIAALLAEAGNGACVTALTVGDRFLPCGSREELIAYCGLTAKDIAAHLGDSNDRT